jgi:hypothetical protein
LLRVTKKKNLKTRKKKRVNKTGKLKSGKVWWHTSENPSTQEAKAGGV